MFTMYNILVHASSPHPGLARLARASSLPGHSGLCPTLFARFGKGIQKRMRGLTSMDGVFFFGSLTELSG